MNVTVTPDPPPRDSRFHRRIVKATPIAGTRSGHDVELECGHRVQTFGRLELADGRVLCDFCRGIVTPFDDAPLGGQS
jgi:hypothetical protein